MHTNITEKFILLHAGHYQLSIKKLSIKILCLWVAVFALGIATAQQGNWTALLHRGDGNNIAFTFDWKIEKGKPVWYIKNALEKIRVDNITVVADSFIVQMP